MSENNQQLNSFDASQTCFFTGNRPQKLPWGTNERDERCVTVKQKLDEVLRELYDDGIRLFVCGMAQGGDTYFAEAVLALKKEREGVMLECALPCPQQTDKWGEKERARYDKILSRADFITYVSDEFTKYCFFVRNRYMLDKSSVCVALDYSLSGGTASTIAQAKRKKVKIMQISH